MEPSDLPLLTDVVGEGWSAHLMAMAHHLLAEDVRGLLRVADDVVVAFRHGDVRALAANADVGNTPAAVLMGAAAGRNAADTLEGGFAPIITNQVFTYNPPLHTEARRILTRQMMPGNVGRLAPIAEAVINAVLDDLTSRATFDLMSDFAEPIATRFWCTLFGLTGAEAAEIQALNAELSTVFLAELSPGQRQALDTAVRRYMHIVTTGAHASARGDRACPDVGRAMLTEMAADLAAITTSGAPRDIGHLVAGNFFDGFHTLSVGLANATCLLLAHPTAHARVRAEPGLASAAYDEGTRLAPPLVFTYRYTLTDVTHAGVHLPPHTRIGMHWAAANIDPTAFAAPTTYELDRHQRGLLTFGAGAHLCPGRNVSRLVGELALRRLLTRLPHLTMEPHAANWIDRSSATQLASCAISNETRDGRRDGEPPRV